MTTPALSGRDIALAHNATRAVLETVLADLDVTFLQSVQLNVLADAGAMRRDQLVKRLVDNLKIGTDDANRAIESLVTADLAAPSADEPGTIERTGFGTSVHGQIQAATNQIVATLYDGLPTEDLVVTQRILATLTERANRKLEHAGRP